MNTFCFHEIWQNTSHFTGNTGCNAARNYRLIQRTSVEMCGEHLGGARTMWWSNRWFLCVFLGMCQFYYTHKNKQLNLLSYRYEPRWTPLHQREIPSVQICSFRGWINMTPMRSTRSFYPFTHIHSLTLFSVWSKDLFDVLCALLGSVQTKCVTKNNII